MLLDNFHVLLMRKCRDPIRAQRPTVSAPSAQTSSIWL